MASLTNEITIKTSEYRPCIVDGRKALFHRWGDGEKVILKEKGFFEEKEYETALEQFKNKSIVKPCFEIEKQKTAFAIVEFEDGTVTECSPFQIRFADDFFNQYAFTEEKQQTAENENRSATKDFTEKRAKCPFCKEGNRYAVIVTESGTGEHFVYCDHCGKETIDTYRTEAAAMKAFANGKTKDTGVYKR